MSSKFVRLSDRLVVNTDHIVWLLFQKEDGYAARLQFVGERDETWLRASERAALEKHLFGDQQVSDDKKQDASPAATEQEKPKEQPFDEWARSLGMYVAEDKPHAATAVAIQHLINFYCVEPGGINITTKDRYGMVNVVTYNASRETARRYLVDLGFVKE